MDTITVVNPAHLNCKHKEHECHYDECNNHIVHDLYQYCRQHMVHQEPLTHVEKPDKCPICFEDDIENKYIILTCGHQLHKECMIKCGRPTCPVCKQFVYMTPDIFLRLRINNLKWKLDNLPIDIDDEMIDAFHNLFDEFDKMLIEEPNETMYKVVGKVLSKFNTIVLNWYY